MPDFLTRRHGTWQFVRRVPAVFAHVDARRVIKHSTRIRITTDRTGRRAALVAETLNRQLELTWQGLARGDADADVASYDLARSRSHELGFDYLEAAELKDRPIEAVLKRIETLVAKGLANDAAARAAVLGTKKRPAFPMSRLLEEYEAAISDEIRDLSPGQLRIWRNERKRAVENFVACVGDKPIAEVTVDDAIKYTEWWRTRVRTENMAVKSANKDIGQLSRMLKEMNVRRRLGLATVFSGLRLRGETDKTRAPFDTAFIRTRLLAPGALDALNEDARLVLHIIAETGLRISEVVNLTENTIHLNAAVPHVQILPEGRRLKTEDSEREIPLVGAALTAIELRPHGFPRYRDRASALSATVNKFLTENRLRPTKDHTVYSLRHSFKDRLVAAEAPDSLIDSLMGHKTYKPKYGRGPSLELKLKYLQRIALSASTGA